MTVPSYTEDLTDLDLAESNTGWVEMTGTDQDGESYNAMGTPAGADGDYPFIQGQYSVTQDCTKNTAVGSLCYNNGAGTGGHGTDGAYFVWSNYMVASNIGSYAQGGFRVIVGSGLGDFDVWYTGGVDKGAYPYGGWQCHVVNTTVTRDNWAGTATATEQYIGSGVYVTVGSSKGEVHNVDAVRYGRGSSIFEFGENADYATIAGFATQNDNNNNRWALVQETAGGYLWQGRMQLGSVTNLVDFRDSDQTIFINWTPKVTANFNTIEVLNDSSYVEMTGFTFQVLDTTTASRGKFLVTDPADIYLEQCTFIDMDTFTFHTASTSADVINCAFRRCELVTQGNAVFQGCTFNTPTASAGFLASDLDIIDNCIFVSDGTGHAIELSPATSGGTYTLDGCTFTDYASVSGSTGNEAIYNNSGGHVTISVGTGQIPSYRNGVGSTTTITGSVPVTITVRDTGGNLLQGVQTAIFVASDRTVLVNEDTDVNGEVNYSYSGTTPVTVEVRCRKASSTDNPRYENYSSLQIIESITGLTLSVSMTEDPNNNATT